MFIKDITIPDMLQDHRTRFHILEPITEISTSDLLVLKRGMKLLVKQRNKGLFTRAGLENASELARQRVHMSWASPKNLRYQHYIAGSLIYFVDYFHIYT